MSRRIVPPGHRAPYDVRYFRRTHPLPKSPCNWHQEATRRIYEALGLKNNSIPKSMHGRFKVDGYTIVVKRHVAGQRGTGKHRLFVDFGGREIPAGRMNQAACKRTKFRGHR